MPEAPLRLNSVLLSLIRHGESEGNVAATLQGCRIDPPLTERGRRQASALAARLAGHPVDGIVVSPLMRARETAAPIAVARGLLPVEDAGLMEFDWGEWTGRRLDEALELDLKSLRSRWRAGEIDLALAGGESPRAAALRCAGVLERVRALGYGSVVLVGHGRVNRILMTVLMGRDVSRMDEVKQRNAGLSVFEWNGGPATPLLLDDIAHLEPELRSRVFGDSSLR